MRAVMTSSRVDDMKLNSHKLKQMFMDEDLIEKYKEAFEMNRDSFKGKVVLDVRCDVGLFSMMAVKAGAAKVIGVDNRSITYETQRVIAENNMTDKIQLIMSGIEDLRLPDGLTQVDVIISSCFGEFPFRQTSVQSVLLARDKFLKPGGLMFPDTVNLYVMGIDDCGNQAENLTFWDSLYGINMKAMAEREMRDPRLMTLNQTQLMTNQFLLQEISLYSVQLRDVLQFKVPFQLDLNKKGYIRGVSLHHSLTFSSGTKLVKFVSGLEAPDKNWRQAVLYLRHFLICHHGDTLTGILVMRLSQIGLKIKLDVELKGKETKIIRDMDFSC